MKFILVIPNLKKANVPVEFTQEQLLEYVACREDPVYFAKTACKDRYS